MVPVPDGSRPAAIQISAELGLPYREGLVKNRYVGRTFIMPDQRYTPEGISVHPLHVPARQGERYPNNCPPIMERLIIESPAQDKGAECAAETECHAGRVRGQERAAGG